MKQMLSTIPFGGFYESWHDNQFESELERAYCDDSGDSKEWSHKLEQHFRDSCNWTQVYKEYAKAYTEKLSEFLKIPMTFVELRSPREYNFGTDQIIVEISRETFKELWTKLDHKILNKLVHEECTSRSGFASFTPNTITEWGPSSTWSPSQLGLLIWAYCKQLSDSGLFNYEEENYLAEDFSGCGHIQNWMWGNCKEGNRLDKIHEYLMVREQRRMEFA